MMLNTDKKITRSGWWNFSRKNIVAVLNQVSQRKKVRASYVKEKFPLMDSATSNNFLSVFITSGMFSILPK